jgi:hypothetical protein
MKLSDLLKRTTDLLEANRNEVLAVAHALETFKTITGDDVVAIIEGSQGPFIDGRRYHTDEFRRLAEEYHRDILHAHEGRVPVEVMLPTLADPSLTPGAAAVPVSGNGAPVEGAHGVAVPDVPVPDGPPPAGGGTDRTG